VTIVLERTLALAASVAPALPPGFEVVEDVFLGESPLLDLAAHFSAQYGKHLPLQLDGSVASEPGKKIPARTLLIFTWSL